jgi:hypothetical protein
MFWHHGRIKERGVLPLLINNNSAKEKKGVRLKKGGQSHFGATSFYQHGILLTWHFIDMAFY